jgi:hypothetical protein
VKSPTKNCCVSMSVTASMVKKAVKLLSVSEAARRTGTRKRKRWEKMSRIYSTGRHYHLPSSSGAGTATSSFVCAQVLLPNCDA